MCYKKFSDLHLFLIVFTACNILHFTIQSNEPVDYFAQGLEHIEKQQQTLSQERQNLYDALKKNNPNAIKNILNINTSINLDLPLSDTKKTFLEEAIDNNNKDAVNLLIKAGANINTRAKNNQSLIEYAITYAADVDIIKDLLSNKNLIITDAEDKSLFNAFYRGNVNILKLLLQDGRFDDVNHQDKDGNTLLHFVAQKKIYGSQESDRNKKQEELAQFLIDNGAEKNIKNLANKTAYDVAKEKPNTSANILNLLKP